jgi:hypothetical protein
MILHLVLSLYFLNVLGLQALFGVPKSSTFITKFRDEGLILKLAEFVLPHRLFDLKANINRNT